MADILSQEEIDALLDVVDDEGDDVLDADHPIMIINDSEENVPVQAEEMFPDTREALDTLTIMDR